MKDSTGEAPRPMRFLDLTLPTPQQNLACDEALLDWREESAPAKPDAGERSEECGAQSDEEHDTGILRFWESPEYFVTLGYIGAAHSEANVDACRARGVPVLRRSSGGGTVFQGPGCLNYALILPIPERGPLSNLSDTNRFVMERQRAAMTTLLGAAVTIEGFTDLALNPLASNPLTPNDQAESGAARRGLKFSGNAQRRKRRTLLFHGTLLLNFDLPLVERLLQQPAKQPAYREGRSHTSFLTNLGVAPEAVKDALKQAWNASKPLAEVPHERIETLAREKYSSDEWNFKF